VASSNSRRPMQIEGEEGDEDDREFYLLSCITMSASGTGGIARMTAETAKPL